MFKHQTKGFFGFFFASIGVKSSHDKDVVMETPVDFFGGKRVGECDCGIWVNVKGRLPSMQRSHGDRLTNQSHVCASVHLEEVKVKNRK